jgi:hypothetical protein
VRGLIDAAALALAVVSALAALVGAWSWWQVRPSRAFWTLARAAQALAVAVALVSGVAAAAGHRPDTGLFWVYALVPVVVSFLGEQLRLASASTILAARELESARDVGALPDAEQRSIVLAILRREMGVMVMAMVVLCFMALRCHGTSAGI